jgi:hypothetical protein
MVGIDTIVLTLEAHEFVLLKPWMFTPHANEVLGSSPTRMGKGKYNSAKRNPTKEDNAEAGYLPYITVYKAARAGGYVKAMRIQFSAPKILVGNNFDEIDEADFENVSQKVFDGLRYYGIRLFGGIDTLRNAKVTTVHYSKNFPLTNYMSTRQAVAELRRCDVNSWRDVSNSEYMEASADINNGHGYKTHSKYHELAFYDKIAEYKKGKRGTPVFDKDSQVQLNMFDDNTMLHYEVLRMEARLNSAKRIKAELARADVAVTELTFKNLFSENISKRVLLQHLADFAATYPKIADAEAETAYQLLAELSFKNPSRNISTIVNAIGLQTLAKEKGVRAVKDLVGTKKAASLARLGKKVNMELKYSAKKAEVFELLEEQLNRFEPVSIKDFIK